MGNVLSNQLDKIPVAINRQIQHFENNITSKIDKLNNLEKNIDNKIYNLEEKLKEKSSLEAKINEEQTETIDKIKNIGLVFSDCFHWKLDISMFVKVIRTQQYVAIFQHKNYRIKFYIHFQKIKINNIDCYKLDDELKIQVLEYGKKEPLYDVTFPFSIIYGSRETINLYLYYDILQNKDIIFLGENNKIVEDIKLNFDTFVNIVEKWIKWAIRYESSTNKN